MLTEAIDYFSNGGEDSKLKVSDVIFYDERHDEANYTGHDTFMSSLMSVDLKPGGFYTEQQLNEVLQSLTDSGMFDKVDLEYRVNLDQSLVITIFYIENTWRSADSFRCINVGVTPPQTEQNPDEARPCLLPPSVHEEVAEMLRDEGKDGMSGRLICKIKDKVEKWYHDEGYVAAQVVNISDLHTKEVVCEVVEGDITRLVLIDVNNNNDCVNELPFEWKKLCNKVEIGNVYNNKESKKVLRNLMSLGLFTNIEVESRSDEMNQGGVVVEIKFCFNEDVDYVNTTDTNFVYGCSSLMNIVKSTFSGFFS